MAKMSISFRNRRRTRGRGRTRTRSRGRGRTRTRSRGRGRTRSRGQYRRRGRSRSMRGGGESPWEKCYRENEKAGKTPEEISNACRNKSTVELDMYGKPVETDDWDDEDSFNSDDMQNLSQEYLNTLTKK